MEAIRDAFGKAMVEVGARCPDVVAVSCDLKGATKMLPFFKAYPERSFEVGIAEANGVSVAAGLALAGLRPFISSFGAFLTGKNVEIRSSIAYNQAPVVLVGTHGGLIGPDGATQASLQDVSVMRSIPGMKVYQPATPVETRAIIHHAADSRDMIYLRIARNEVPELFDPATHYFVPGRGFTVREGEDMTIISSGPPVHAALQAAAMLAPELSIRVVNLPSLKPVDKALILQCARETRLIVTVEDHDIAGGLGGIVAEIIAGAGLPCPVVRHGLDDVFISSCKPAELERQYRLDAPGVAEVVLEAWSRYRS